MLHQQQEMPACCWLPKPQPVRAHRDKFWRVTIGLLLFSKLYPYTRAYGCYFVRPYGGI